MSKIIDSSVVFSLISDYYDWALVIDTAGGRVNVLHMSAFLTSRGLIPESFNTFEQVTEKFGRDLVVEEEKEAFADQARISYIVEEIKNKGTYVRTVHIDAGDGVRAESLRINMLDDEGIRLLACLTDITAILDHDSMTDEYSRSGFISRAAELLEIPILQSGYSVVYANIKGFKAMNDLLGTSSGDMIIFMERDLLVRILKPVLIARLESDHFALITADENLTDENFALLAGDTYIEGSKRMPVPIRCGIYHINDKSKKVQYMLDRAKLAEKSIVDGHGITYAVCDERMSEEYVTQRYLVAELDDALSRHEFKPYYQPIVDAVTGEIVSAEALIRWNNSKQGMISPGKFIPLFEKEGVISKVDAFMINSVLNFNIRRMEQKKKIVPCAVNLSRVDFYDTSLLDTIKNKLAEYENVKEMLKLEVTESAYEALETGAIEFMREMQRLGLSLLLDDYGSGMSSLSSFESFPFDVLKLDMGFVSQIGKNDKAEAIIRHTIGLSHDVGAKVVAEGVETEEQAEFLRSVNCDMFQGYHFYRPMPEEEFEKLLQ